MCLIATIFMLHAAVVSLSEKPIIQITDRNHVCKSCKLFLVNSKDDLLNLIMTYSDHAPFRERPLDPTSPDFSKYSLIVVYLPQTDHLIRFECTTVLRTKDKLSLVMKRSFANVPTRGQEKSFACYILIPKWTGVISASMTVSGRREDFTFEKVPEYQHDKPPPNSNN